MTSPEVAAAGTTPDEPSLRRRIVFIPLVVACALLMQAIDSSVLMTSLPIVAEGLGTDPVSLKLSFAAYYLGVGLFIPVSGLIADRLGTRDTFCLAVLIFMVASILCGQSEALIPFISYRFLQGVGGAMMVPVGRIAILRAAPKAHLVAAMGYFTMPAFIGPLIGPAVGAVVTAQLGWQWIFYLNLPLCVGAIVFACFLFENNKNPRAGAFDYTGFVCSTLGGGLLMFSVMTGNQVVTGRWAWLCSLAGILLFTVCVLHSKRISNPLLDFRLFGADTFRQSVFGGSITRAGSSAVPFLVMLLFQLAFGLTAFESGLALGAACIGALGMKFAAPPLMRRFGFRTVLVWCSIANSMTTLLLALLCFFPSLPWIFTVFVAGMIVRTLQYTALNTIVYSDVEPSRMSHAAALAGSAQELSMGLGMAIGGWVLEASLRGTALHGPALTPLFAVAFLVTGSLSAGILPFMTRLKPHAGSAISGHGAAATPESERAVPR